MPETPNTVTNATREQLCGSSQSYKSLLPLYRDIEVAVIILLSENMIICLFVTKHSQFLRNVSRRSLRIFKSLFIFGIVNYVFFKQCRSIVQSSRFKPRKTVRMHNTHLFCTFILKTYNLEVCGQTELLGVQNLVRVTMKIFLVFYQKLYQT